MVELLRVNIMALKCLKNMSQLFVLRDWFLDHVLIKIYDSIISELFYLTLANFYLCAGTRHETIY